MSVRNWPSLAAKTAVAASLLAAAAACSSSGSSSPPAAGGATSTAPLSTAALVSGSKQEKGLVIYSNALSSQMQEVTKAFQAKYPWIHVTVTDDEDPVVFSKYAAQHAAGVRTADLLIVSNLTHAGDPWAIVENVIVDRAARRGGIGRALMSELLRRCDAAGCYKVQLLSRKHRHEAHAFYRSLGFEPVAEGFRRHRE